MELRVMGLLVLLLLAACSAYEPHWAAQRPTMLGDCTRNPPAGWSHCSARLRPWGESMW